MKLLKKLMVVFVAALMIMSLTSRAYAEETPVGTGTITVKKNYEDQTYKLYKIFDATTSEGRTSTDTDKISYRLMDGKTNFKVTVDGTEIDGARWFKVDSAGNVSLADGVTSITFDETFRKWAENYGVKNPSDKTANQKDDPNVSWSNLTEGYYFVTTTTGSLVSVDSIKPNVEIEDKNTIPEVDKTITGASSISDEGKKALAQIGTDVEYTAVVTVGKGSKNLVFHDTMQEGLTFKGNDNVTLTSNPAITEPSSWYTIKPTPDTGETLTITFVDGIPEGTEITIKYLATINANALTPLKNDAVVSFGDKNTHTQESETEVYNAQISVIKYDGEVKEEGAKYLGGAGFKLKNSDGKFYHLEGTVVSWVEEANGDEHISAATDGTVPAFTGLKDGAYTLVETKVPKGYNQAADQPITIVQGNYTPANLSQVAKIANQTGAELPSTGGIGTTIFHIAGAALVLGAGILLISKKRMNNN